MSYYKSSEINQMTHGDQLKFYRDEFEGRHCVLDGCGHEVGNDWAIYRSSVYCLECYDWLRNDEKMKALKEIKSLKDKIITLKKENGVINEDEVD